MEDRVEKGEDGSFNRVLRESLTEKGALEQSPKGGERMSQATSGGLFL